MSSPHVAGLAAYLISKFDLSDPAQVEEKLKCLCTTDAISGIYAKRLVNTPNKLIYNGATDNDICSDKSSTTIPTTDKITFTTTDKTTITTTILSTTETTTLSTEQSPVVSTDETTGSNGENDIKKNIIKTLFLVTTIVLISKHSY